MLLQERDASLQEHDEERARFVDDNLALHASEEQIRFQRDRTLEAQCVLEESHERYVRLYDSAPVAYVTLSPEGLLMELNLTATALLGWSRNRLTGAPFRPFVVPADQ